jgi:hypothetical protein
MFVNNSPIFDDNLSYQNLEVDNNNDYCCCCNDNCYKRYFEENEEINNDKLFNLENVDERFFSLSNSEFDLKNKIDYNNIDESCDEKYNEDEEKTNNDEFIFSSIISTNNNFPSIHTYIPTQLNDISFIHFDNKQEDLEYFFSENSTNQSIPPILCQSNINNISKGSNKQQTSQKIELCCCIECVSLIFIDNGKKSKKQNNKYCCLSCSHRQHNLNKKNKKFLLLIIIIIIIIFVCCCCYYNYCYYNYCYYNYCYYNYCYLLLLLLCYFCLFVIIIII